MSMPIQLDVDAAGVAHLTQGPHDRREVDLPFAEHQMLVHAATHVLDMDVPEAFLPLAKPLRDRDFTQAVQMANIDGHPEHGTRHRRADWSELRQRVDQHPW